MVLQVFPAAEKDVIEAIVESNCGDFEDAFEKMLEISATPRSLNRIKHYELDDDPRFICMSEDIMYALYAADTIHLTGALTRWLVLRRVADIDRALVACTCRVLATIVDSGQSRGLIPPRAPKSLSHAAPGSSIRWLCLWMWLWIVPEIQNF